MTPAARPAKKATARKPAANPKSATGTPPTIPPPPASVVNKQRAAKPGSTTGVPKRVMLAVSDRRNKAVEMYLMGVDPLTIGRTLSRQKGTPYGYDGEATDDSLGATVSKDITRAMEARARPGDANVATLRAELTSQHRRIVAALMTRVLAGDPAAATSAGGHLARIARLNGVDEPTKVAIASSDPAVQKAVDEIMGLIGVSSGDDEPGEGS